MTIQQILVKHNITQVVKDPCQWAKRQKVACSFLTFQNNNTQPFWIRFKNGDGISAFMDHGCKLVRIPKRQIDAWWQGSLDKYDWSSEFNPDEFDKRNHIVRGYSNLYEAFIVFESGDAVGFAFQTNELSQPQTLYWIFDEDIATIVEGEIKCIKS